MSTVTKKPPIKETVGAQYICFNKMDDDNQWTEDFEDIVEKTEVVKSVKVSENAESSDTYASGIVYDSDTATTTTEIEVEVVAFPDDTLCRMRGDLVSEGGLILSCGKRVRPYFAYGKVVKFKGGKFRLDWYPKCKMTENSDDTSTKEDKASEQTDTIKITAYPFNEDGDIVAKVASGANCPEGLTESMFFSKPILTAADLASVLSGANVPAQNTNTEEVEDNA